MECPRTYPLQILSRKWSYFVLRALRHERSFSDLKKELKFITNRILSRELSLLQEEQLVTHDDTYALTPRARELLDALEPLVRWSVKHGKRPCPSEMECSRCANYPEAVGHGRHL